MDGELITTMQQLLKPYYPELTYMKNNSQVIPLFVMKLWNPHFNSLLAIRPQSSVLQSRNTDNPYHYLMFCV